jgi:bifunctional non-homologous end joining protein LigD
MPPSLSRWRALWCSPERHDVIFWAAGPFGLAAILVFFAFDLLHLDGEDLRRATLLARKGELETLLRRASPIISFSGRIVGNGAKVFAEAAKSGLEGIVSKQIDKPYAPGNRGIWVKSKYLNRQEFVVVGWTDP